MIRSLFSRAAKFLSLFTTRAEDLSELQKMEWVSIPAKDRKAQFGLDVCVTPETINQIKATLYQMKIPTGKGVLQRNGKTYLRVTDKAALSKISEALKNNITDQPWSAVKLRNNKVVYRVKIDPNSAAYARLMESMKIHNITVQTHCMSGTWGYVEVSGKENCPKLKTIIGFSAPENKGPQRGFLGPKIIAHNFAR